MREIPRSKKMEIAQYYVLGDPYGDIERKTGVSHGSIVNIVKELENGKLNIPGTAFDNVNDLRQLSLDLKKKGLSTSQALLGLSTFENTIKAGVTPDYYDKWAQLMNKFAANSFPAGDFLNAAIRLNELETESGKSFETLIGEFNKATDYLARIKVEANSLETKKTTLSAQATSLSSHLKTVTEDKKKLQSEVEALSVRRNSLESELNEAKDEHTRLKKEVRELSSQRTKLAVEVDGKEASLARISDIGLTDQDLLGLKSILETIATDNSVGQEEIKERFFGVLATFKDISGLKKAQAQEQRALDHLTKEKFILTGEIAVLEQTKNVLQGQIMQATSSAIGKITDAGNTAALELKQQADSIKDSFDDLVKQAAEVGMAVGKMKAVVKKGKDSEKSLGNFIRDVRLKVVNDL